MDVIVRDNQRSNTAQFPQRYGCDIGDEMSVAFASLCGLNDLRLESLKVENSVISNFGWFIQGDLIKGGNLEVVLKWKLTFQTWLMK